jgi:pyruvate/2-oxoglutarate dehydrogenase complex dihydrolipoamide dehydrogenase (E3) component
MEKLKIPVTLGKQVTREDVKAFAPDIAIVATGAVPLGLDIPGGQGKHLAQANDIISGKVKAKGRVAVIGGRVLGMEAAEFLGGQGHEVALISRSALGGRKGPDDMITFRGLLRKMVDMRIPIYLNAGVLEIKENAVMISLGEEVLAIPADTVVLAVGVKADDRLAGELKGIVAEIFTIGDCMQPGNAAQATFSGARIAMKV